MCVVAPGAQAEDEARRNSPEALAARAAEAAAAAAEAAAAAALPLHEENEWGIEVVSCLRGEGALAGRHTPGRNC